MKFPIEARLGRPFDAVGFGLNAVDHLIVVPEYPAFDTKTRFNEYERSAGGQTASAMVALQRLGLQTAYAGRFGSLSGVSRATRVQVCVAAIGVCGFAVTRA